MRRLLIATACTLLVSCAGWHVARLHEECELPLRVRREMHGALDDMAREWDAMSQGRARDRKLAEDRYEHALASFISLWNQAQEPRFWSSRADFGTETGKGRFVVEIDAVDSRRRGGSPREYDDLIVPGGFSAGKAHKHAARPGVGVPITGRVEKNGRAGPGEVFLPPKGGHFTLTAVMDIAPPAADGQRRCHLRLHNSLNTDTVPAPGGERQLAADYATPKKLALSRSTFGRLSLIGMLYPEKALKDCHLYVMDEYDPQRIPVVFVHGLLSDPHIWLDAVQAICEDPVLRRRYQPWYFLYPTAMGLPQASGRLRDSLLLARDHFDPDHNDPGMQRMVLIGHSMGGLLSRMQVTESGDELWKSLFSKPPADLQVSELVRARLQKTLFIKPLPFVQRVVFIATPHRGSRIASLSIVRLLTGLVRVPFDSLNTINELVQGNADAVVPQISEWGVFSFLSVGMLSDEHPLLKGLDRTRPVVAHHSVIGDRGLKRSGVEQSSDGVVPYRSSHLDSAASEKIVPYYHGCSDKPEVVKELVRVLHEHLR